MSGLWIVVLTRIAVGIAAGEISIRYLYWWWVLRASGERFIADSLVLGVAICAGALSAIDIQWMVIQASPRFRDVSDMTAGYTFVEVARLVLLAGSFFLSYPIVRVQYKHSWRRVLIELIVRVFLVAVAFLAGIECSTLYHCHFLGFC